jgi:hypothetical protein
VEEDLPSPESNHASETHARESSVAKGNRFEQQVFLLLKRWVQSPDAWVNHANCRLYKKKGYFSTDRDDNIEIDISIECGIPSREGYAQLIAVECKNYSHPVPVNDIEEFNDKLRQIAGKNVKGMVFTTQGFQDGAVRVALKQGIALARVLPDDQVEWVLQRAPAAISPRESKDRHNAEVLRALIEPSYIGRSEMFFGIAGRTISTSPYRLLNSLVDPEIRKAGRRTAELASVKRTRSRLVPFMGLQVIEERASKMRGHLDKLSRGPFDLKSACEYFTSSHRVNFVFDEDLGLDSSGRPILGRLCAPARRVCVDRGLTRDEKRWRFTLCHELGHLVLHRALNLPRVFAAHSETAAGQQLATRAVDPGLLGRLEWQANTFASCALMPREHVYDSAVELLTRRSVNNFGHGLIYVDNQRCNLKTFYSITDAICREFNVSRQVATYRLAQLRLLNDQRSNTSLQSLLNITPDFGAWLPG